MTTILWCVGSVLGAFILGAAAAMGFESIGASEPN